MGLSKKAAAEERQGKALRYNEGKLKWGLVHFPSIEPLVKVLMFGAKKYAPNNWKKPMDRQEILESAMRHLTAMISGEIKDPESKLPHAGHVLCNMMFYVFHTNALEKALEEANKNITFTPADSCCGDWDNEGNCKCKAPEDAAEVEAFINGAEPFIVKKTKRFLSEDEKQSLYSEKNKYSKEELATRWDVSLRTVFRIFDENGN